MSKAKLAPLHVTEVPSINQTLIISASWKFIFWLVVGVGSSTLLMLLAENSNFRYLISSQFSLRFLDFLNRYWKILAPKGAITSSAFMDWKEFEVNFNPHISILALCMPVKNSLNKILQLWTLCKSAQCTDFNLIFRH